jgi:hypothetical protein
VRSRPGVQPGHQVSVRVDDASARMARKRRPGSGKTDGVRRRVPRNVFSSGRFAHRARATIAATDNGCVASLRTEVASTVEINGQQKIEQRMLIAVQGTGCDLHTNRLPYRPGDRMRSTRGAPPAADEYVAISASGGEVDGVRARSQLDRRQPAG